MDTKKVISLQNKIFFEVKNLWELSEKGTKSNIILDNFLDELSMKKTPENRFIAYARIADLRAEPLDLYLDKINEQIIENNKINYIKIPNKLENKREVINKSYMYVKKIYENLSDRFIFKLEEEKVLSNFELTIFKGVLKVGKAFNNFTTIWEDTIIKQNAILDKKFNGDSEKIMQFLRDKNLLELDEKGNETDRSYSVLRGGKAISYFEAFTNEINFIAISLQDFIEELKLFDEEEKNNYINYLTSIKEAFLEKNINKLLSKWQKVDENWMQIKGPLQIVHPLEFYEDKYRKCVAPKWDLRILDRDILNSRVEKDIKIMYEKIYDEIGRNKYSESYNFSKENLNRVQLYISEPVMYFGAGLNGLFSAQVVPNDEEVSEKFGKKIFAHPKMVLESRKKSPIMKLTKDILDENLLNDYLKLLEDDSLYFSIYDIETIGHEFGHTLWLTKNSEVLMNKKTGNFKNIEEFKATTGGLYSYFFTNNSDEIFNKNIFIMHLARCIGLLKYRKVSEVLPYYNESLIHLDIMFESNVFKIINNKIILNFSEKNWKNLKNNYLKHYKKLINIYLEKLDAGIFLYDYVVKDSNGDNVPQNKILQEFGNYYYDLYKKIGNELV